MMGNKLSYEELERRVQELEREKSSFKKILKKREKALSLLEIAEDIGMTGCWSLNLESGHEEWSTGEYHIHGLSKEISPSFETHLQCVHPEDKEQHVALFQEYLASDKTEFTQEYRIQKHDGIISHIQANYHILRDESGRPHTAYGTNMDITERKQAEETLLESEAKYRFLADTMADIVWTIDMEFKTTYVSPSVEKILGFTLEERYKQKAEEMLVPDSLHKAQEKLLELLKQKEDGTLSQEFITLDVEYYTKDGSTIWMENSIKFIYDAENEAIGILGVSRDITQRRKAEERLKSNALWLQGILNVLDESVLVITPDRKLTNVNRTTSRMFGYSEKELINQSTEVLHVDHGHYIEFEEQIKQSFNKGRTANFEFKAKRKNGQIFPSEHSVSQLMDDSGHVIGIVSVVRDLSDRKKSEESLKRSELRLLHMLETLEMVAVSLDAQGNITFCNHFLLKLTGWPRQEVIGKNWFDKFLPPEIRETIRQSVFLKTFKTGSFPAHYNNDIITKKGEHRYINWNNTVIKNTQGDIVGVTCIGEDITERILYQNQLIASQKEWEDIFQAIGQPTIILDPEHGIIKANKAALNITGLSEKQLTDRKCFDIFHKTGEPPKSCPMDALLHKGSLETVEMVMEALDGTFLVSCTPITSKDGKLEKIIHIATDITETKKLESQLHQALKMEALGTLSGGVAHEFNNILGIILGNTELAIDDVPEWNPAKECLEEIRKASLRAKDVVRQILSFSRKTLATRKPLNISTIIQESLKLVRATIPSNIEIRTEFLCESEIILANLTEINQIFINLCSNSVHAIEGETGFIKIRLEKVIIEAHNANLYEDLKAGEHVKLTIEDSGCGVNPKILELIFDPYFTTKDVDKGLGMGLAVVYGIVKKHDGAVKVNSKLGKGTTVEVLFPITLEQTDIIVEELDDLPKGIEKILFVDDEPSLVNLVKKILEQQGYKVVGKTSSVEALKLFQEESVNFNLVITDMAMPEMPGDRLAQEIIKIRPSIPVIACTGHSDRIDESRAEELGIKAYTMKPFVRKDFLKIVRKVLNEAKKRS